MANNREVQRAMSLMENGMAIVREQLSSSGVGADSPSTILRTSTPSTASGSGTQLLGLTRMENGMAIVREQLSSSGVGADSPSTTLRTSTPSTASSTGTPLAHSSVLQSRNVVAELRRNFQPYDHPSTGRGGRRQPIINRSLRTSRPRQWNHRIMCLGGPSDTVTPSTLRKAELQDFELGLQAIQIGSTASSEQFQSEVLKLYPKTLGIDFEVLRSLGGGAGKTFAPISRTRSIPDVVEMETVVGSSMVYIRPMVDLLENSVGQQMEQLRAPQRADAVESTSTLPSPAQVSNVEVTNNNSFYDCFSEQGTLVQETDQPRQSVMMGEGITIRSTAGPAQVEDSQFMDVNDVEGHLTLKEWRQELYAAYPAGETTTIFVQRDDFANCVLGVYKRTSIDLYKPPEVIFAGEAGVDAGALTKEYFWLGMQALYNGKYNNRYPFFEGEADGKLPCADSLLLRTGIFRLIGKFFLHCAIHMGIAFIGLSHCVSEYLTAEHIDAETSFTISITDMSDHSVRQAVEVLDIWLHRMLAQAKTGEELPQAQLASDESQIPIEPSDDELKLLKDTATECGFFATVDKSTAHLLREHLLYHYAIDVRRPQLEAMREGFWDQKLCPFVAGKEYLVQGLFPKWRALNVPTRLLLDKIQCNEGLDILNHVKQYITEKCEDGVKKRNLILAWTGWPELPEYDLKIRIGEIDEPFRVLTCFQEMVIPTTYGKTEVYDELDRLINNPTGFGLM